MDKTCDAKCQVVSGTGNFIQHPLQDKLVCGFTNNSFNYENIPKPASMTGLTCESSEMLTCPGRQDLERQVCVDDLKKCPINGISVKFEPIQVKNGTRRL